MLSKTPMSRRMSPRMIMGQGFPFSLAGMRAATGVRSAAGTDGPPPGKENEHERRDQRPRNEAAFRAPPGMRPRHRRGGFPGRRRPRRRGDARPGQVEQQARPLLRQREDD